VRQFLVGFADRPFSNICAFSSGDPWEFLEEKRIVTTSTKTLWRHVQDDPRNR
jgi:hypothetical protein